jgi:hypothetical protein
MGRPGFTPAGSEPLKGGRGGRDVVPALRGAQTPKLPEPYLSSPPFR